MGRPRKMKLNESQRKLLATLVFMLKLLAFAVPLYIVMSLPGLLLPLQEAVSANVHSLLGLIGFDVVRDGFSMASGDIAFFVSEDCTGWKSMLLLTALIFAVPGAGMRKRIAGVALGVTAVYLGNLARIIAVVLAWKAFGPGFAGLVHGYFWQAGLILLVLAVWIAWLAWAGKLRRTLLRRDRKINKTAGKTGKEDGVGRKGKISGKGRAR